MLAVAQRLRAGCGGGPAWGREAHLLGALWCLADAVAESWGDWLGGPGDSGAFLWNAEHLGLLELMQSWEAFAVSGTRPAHGLVGM